LPEADGSPGSILTGVESGLPLFVNEPSDKRISRAKVLATSFIVLFSVLGLVRAELSSMKVPGWPVGVILTADGVAREISPWSAGHMRHITASYFGGFLALVGIAPPGTVTGPILQRPRRTA
jgi:hypothetical protein